MYQTSTCMYRRKLLVFLCYILDYVTVKVQGIHTTLVLKNPFLKYTKCTATGNYKERATTDMLQFTSREIELA